MEKEKEAESGEEQESKITYNIDAHDSIMIVKWEFGIKKST